MTMTNDRPDLSSEGAPTIDKTILVNVNRNKYPVMRPIWALKPGLTDWQVVGRNVTLTLTVFQKRVMLGGAEITQQRPAESMAGETSQQPEAQQKYVSVPTCLCVCC
jgi:hypothetical protein